jgi:signal transduction histidine kinase
MRTFALQALVGARPGRPEARLRWFLLCACGIVLVAAADYATGYEVSLSVLYLAAVALGTWVLGLRWGLGLAALATGTWYLTFLSAHTYSHAVYFGWEALIRASTAIIFAIVVDRLRLALEHSDERFVTVLQGLDAAVYVASPATGALLYVNDHSRAAFGSVLRSLNDIERRFADQQAIAPDSAPRDQREVQDLMTGRWFLVNRRALRWVDGTTVDLHMATDITQRKQAERLAQDRQDRLEMTSRLVTAGEMASTLAHELNQPLASILNYNTGCAALLQSSAASTAEVLEGLEKSSEQAERAAAILQHVRDFIARSEPQFAACSVSELVRDSARLISAQAARSGVEIELQGSDEPLEVQADKVMLQQLLLNLSKNAIESMADTPPNARRLTFRWQAVEGSILIEIADRGSGLPPELKANLFLPFFSTKPSGMGLGLQICRSVAEHHDGRLWASSRDGGGTVLHFAFFAKRL